MSARSFVIFPISRDVVREVLDDLIHFHERIASNLETKYLMLTDPAGDALALGRDRLGYLAGGDIGPNIFRGRNAILTGSLPHIVLAPKAPGARVCTAIRL
jgi:hypothetical protein